MAIRGGHHPQESLRPARKGVTSMETLSSVSGLLASIAGHFRWGWGAAPVQPPSTGFLEPGPFASALIGMARRKDDRNARLHVFSIGDFRRAAGSKWDRLGGLVEAAADGIVRRHIDMNKDAFTRLDTEIWCLALSRSSRPETRACVAAITRDLSVQLVGDTVIGGRRPQVIGANLALRAAVTAEGDLNRRAILDAVNRVAGSCRATLAAVDDSNTHQPLTPSGLRLNAAPRLPPVFAISGGEKERSPAEGIPDWLDQQLADQTAVALARERQMAAETKLTLAWTPIWVSNRRALGAFQARVIRADADAFALREGVHAYTDAAPVEALTLDRFVASRAARELTNLFLGKQRSMGLTVPIHWMSLAPRWRDCIRMPFEACAATARRKLLKIELFGLTPAIPPSILNNLMAPLEKLGCDVLARVPLKAPEMVHALRGVHAIGVDLAELGNHEPMSDDELLARLLVFRDAARQAKLACYVWSVQRRLLISRIVEAGFSLISGPGLMGDLRRPVLPAITSRAA